MKRNQIATLLLVLALIDAAGALTFWLLKGANRGWTRTQVEVVSVDEVTGLEGRKWERRFVPGVDLLAASLLGAAATAVVALIIRKPENQNA
jgi:hypothetical protein